ILLPDNDDAGRNHASLVATRLNGTAKRIRILHLSGLPPKGDVVEWFRAGRTREELLRLVERAPEFSAPPEEENSDAEFNAEIRRLAKLSPRDYERVRKDAAKKLGLRASTLDR